MANRDLPRAQGLYDPANEHDSCGVAFVVDLHGRKSHEMVGKGITALCNLEHRGRPAPRSTPVTAPASSCRSPDRFLRAVVDFELPGGRRLRHRDRVPPQGPDGRRQGRGRHRRDRRRRGAARPRLARRPDRRLDARWHRRGGRAVVPPAVHRRRRADAISRSSGARSSCASGSSTRSDVPGDTATTPSTSRASRAARSSTRACSPPRSSRSSSPTCATSGSRARSPSCTRGSRPTRSRRGRSPTRTATSPTTARSTR